MNRWQDKCIFSCWGLKQSVKPESIIIIRWSSVVNYLLTCIVVGWYWSLGRIYLFSSFWGEVINKTQWLFSFFILHSPTKAFMEVAALLVLFSWTSSVRICLSQDKEMIISQMYSKYYSHLMSDFTHELSLLSRMSAVSNITSASYCMLLHSSHILVFISQKCLNVKLCYKEFSVI